MSRHAKKLKLLAITTAVLLALTAVGALIGYWMVVPSMAEDALRQRVSKLEQRAMLEVSTGDIEPNGLKGVKISHFVIKDPAAPEGHQILLEIESLLVDVDKQKLLTGQKVISSLTIDDATLYIHRDSENVINLERILEHVRSTQDSTSPNEVNDTDNVPSFLRHFGGTWPELEVHKASIAFSSDAAPFPLSAIHTDTVSLDPDGTRAHFETTLSLKDASSSGTIVLPTSISSSGTLAVPLEQSSLSFNFDRPFRVANIPLLPPSLQIGLSDVELSEGGKITLTQLTLEDTASPSQAPLLETERAFLQLEKFTTRRSQPRPLSLSLEKPRAHVHILEDGSVPILSQLIPSTISPPTTPPTGSTQPAPSSTSSRTERLKARLRDLDLTQLTGFIPNTIDIKDAHLSIQDDRPNTHELVHFARHLEIRDAQLQLDHDADKGALSIDAALQTLAGPKAESLRPHGELNFKLSSNYKTRLLKLDATANTFDLSLLSQFTPIAALANHLKGGILNASIELNKQPSSPLAFKGDVSIEQGHFTSTLLAEEPLTDWSIGYDFEGTYDANAPIPPAKLLTTALDANVPEDPEEIGKSSRRITIPPPTKGALVLTRGKLRAGTFRANITPSFYGLDRNKTLPARMDLAITFPPTPIQEILDATPDALLGQLAQAKIDGSVKMDFLLEVPLYDASNMVWRGEPETSNAAIAHLPPEVDVRHMVDTFTHTIDDESVLYSRTITIPSMQLIPSQWLAENAGLEPEQVDRHWERGNWVPMENGVVDLEHTRYRTASKPWTSRQDARIVRHWKPYRDGQTSPMVSAPYGPYTFVPLQHISHWLVRAILTTEDNSFFKHDGFNRLAFRQSVERDLAEGDYVRGASTISMQLIKNLYLTRKKVMARKIQEALLVWLTESVVQVPKGRMLEIYLNIIEFAPGVFGIHDAAVHYFGKRPDELTLAECAWLVTIVPGPKFYHKHFMRGEMSDYMFERIKRYMAIMHKRERVSAEELAQASLQMPQFHQPELLESAIAPLPQPEPVDELEALFPDLFGPSNTPTNPLAPSPHKVPLIDPKPQPLKQPAPTPRAQPDPAPPSLKLP